MTGLFVLGFGIVLSVKSMLGSSAVASLPYTANLLTNFELGNATIMFHGVLLFVQVLILRREFKLKNLLQVFVAVILGKLVTLSNFLLSSLIIAENDFIFQYTILFVSIIFLAIGIFMIVVPDMIPLPFEGTIIAISKKWNISFAKVKICFDVSLVLLSAVICLIFKGNFGSVGVGTVISAVLVGMVISVLNKQFKDKIIDFIEKK